MLNQSQLSAVKAKSGPALVLAGPGSGKTLVITHRIKNLIEEYHISPSNILVITFTKAAAVEMKERFLKLMNGKTVSVTFGTFHSAFFRILKFAYRYNPEHIISEEQRIEIIRELIREASLEIEDEGEFLMGILSEISLVKGEMLPLEHYYSQNCPENTFKQIYRGYEDQLRKNNKIDFDDMMTLCYELLSARPDILAQWQNKYQYILVDEFQDINTLQYKIVSMLAGKSQNLFVVGDDDQSIYRFRGAKPEIMLGFERDFPRAKRYLLDTNYRSTKKIVKASGRLIAHNQKRFPKDIHTDNPEGDNIFIRQFSGLKEENEAVVNLLEHYLDQGYGYEDIGILYRTNTGPRLLVEKLMERNIPFRMRDSIPNLFEHWIAKDLMTYIRLAMGNRSREEFLKIVNRPNRYMARNLFTEPEVSFDRLRALCRDKEWMEERIDKLEYDLRIISRISPFAAVQYIRKGVGYEDFIREYARYRRMNAKEMFDILEEIHATAEGCKTFVQWFEQIHDYTSKLKEQAMKEKDRIHGICISTMHSAKGLEYPVVILPDVNETIIPHARAVLDADIEEERRLFYVAVTRAKERLHIFSVQERYNREMEESRFVEELFG